MLCDRELSRERQASREIFRNQFQILCSILRVSLGEIARHRPDPRRANLWWSALAVECLELWSMRFHTICHTSRKTNHLCSTTLFSQDEEYNANS